MWTIENVKSLKMETNEKKTSHLSELGFVARLSKVGSVHKQQQEEFLVLSLNPSYG